MSGNLVWDMDVEQLEVFFTLVHLFDLQTEEERANLLLLMASNGYVRRVYRTERTKEQLLSDLSRHSKVLHVKGE